MKSQIQQRLDQLQAEYESGQQMLADLEARQAELRQTMLRISGAMQVLEELLASTPDGDEMTLAEPLAGMDSMIESVDVADGRGG